MKALLKASQYIAILAIGVISQNALSQDTAPAKKEDSGSIKQYEMCVAVRMKEINIEHLQNNPEKFATKIPKGWSVISGAGGEGHPKVLLCR